MFLYCPVKLLGGLSRVPRILWSPNFRTVSTKACHLCLSWSTQSHRSTLRSVLIKSSRSFLALPRVLLLQVPPTNSTTCAIWCMTLFWPPQCYVTKSTNHETFHFAPWYLLCTLYLNTLNLYSPLNVRHQGLHTYKTAGKMAVLHHFNTIHNVHCVLHCTLTC